MADNDNIIVITDEDGNDIELELLDLIEFRGEEYVVLFPLDENDSEVIILKLEKTDNEDEEVMSSLQDESVIEAVFEIFKEKFKDEFNFV